MMGGLRELSTSRRNRSHDPAIIRGVDRKTAGNLDGLRRALGALWALPTGPMAIGVMLTCSSRR
jgi:hypothetical protein